MDIRTVNSFRFTAFAHSHWVIENRIEKYLISSPSGSAIISSPSGSAKVRMSRKQRI